MDKKEFKEQLIAEAYKTDGDTAKKVRDMISGNSGVDIPESKKKAKEKSALPEGFRESQITQVSNEVSIPQFTVQTYTPGSDLATGNRKNQIVYGRDGNDFLIGLDPFANNPGTPQIDILIGDVPILQSPTPRDWRDTFTLGDSKQPYYVNGGFNDFAIILDFNPSQDIIQLHGKQQDYLLAESSVGTEIYFQQKDKQSEFIGFLPFVYDLSLKGDYFQFEGNTPPKKPVLEQTKQLGTAGLDLSVSTATDSLGNVYLAGGTTGSLGGPNAGARDAFLAKYNSNGNQAWIKQLGTSSFDTIADIATDNQGNSYVSGYTEGSLGGPRQGLFSDAWLAKYDSNGNQVWIRQFGTEIINFSLDIDVDNNGNVYASGFTVRIGQQGGPIPDTDDYWVTKYDTNGNRQWFKQFGSPIQPNTLNFDEAYGVAVASDGNVYATGFTVGNLAGQNAGLYDGWVSKHDNTGNLLWTRQFGTADYEFSWDADSDSKGNVYATGWTLGNLGGQNAGSYDPWLVKYDTNGNQVWLKQFGTSGDDEAFGVNVDSNDNIFVTGYTENNLEGKNAGSFDAWVAKYDSNGNQIWIQQFGTPDFDQAYSVAVDNFGSLYVTGVTEGSFGATNAGSVDSWVARLDAQSGTLQSFTSGTSGNNLVV